MRSNLGYFVVISCALLNWGCTRGSSSSSVVRLNVADAASLKAQKNSVSVSSTSSAQLMNVVVNITGPGIDAPIYYQWQTTCTTSATCASLPSDIELTVPRGSSRLIQVLGMYSDGLTFRYGQVTQDFSAPAMDVDVSIHAISSSLTQAHVIGRILNVGTGELQGHFQPPNGAPSMLIIRSAIFAGWFDVVGLSGADFTYTYNGNAVLVDLSLDSTLLLSNAPNFTRIHAPAFSRVRTDTVSGVSVTSTIAEPEQDFILGFFGSVSSQITCYPDVDSAIASATLGSSTTTLLQYSGTAAVSESEVTHRNGGVAASGASTCALTTTEFADHLVFNEQGLRDGRDAVGGFIGPWRLDSNLNPVTVSPGSSGATLAWNFLPDTTTGTLAIAGVSVQARSGSRTDGIYNGGGVACSQASNLGFSEIANQATVAGVTTGQIVIPNSAFNSQQIVLCPYVVVSGVNVFSDSGVEAVMPASSAPSLVLTATSTETPSSNDATSPNTLFPNVCRLYNLSLAQNGYAVAPATNTTVYFSMQGALKAYSNSACNSQTSSATIAAGYSSAQIYLKNSGSAQLFEIGMYSGSVPNVISGQFSLASSGSASAGVAAIAVHFDPAVIGGSLTVGSCYPVLLELISSSGSPTIAGSGFSLTLGTSDVIGTYYENAVCSGGGTSSVDFGSYDAALVRYFKPTATTTSGLLTVDAGSSASYSGSSPAFVVH